MASTNVTSAEVAERYKKLVESFQAEIINTNWGEAKKYLHPDVTVHFPIGGSSLVPTDPDGVIEMFKEAASWFRFVKAEPKLWAAGKDSLFEVVELHFEHTGDFFGVPATGRRFSINGLGAWRFQDGLIHDHWGQYDMASIPQKLGVDVPGDVLAPPQAPAEVR
jgi:predicted SnoaL-like aldol condensation-catalyzing enzyme